MNHDGNENLPICFSKWKFCVLIAIDFNKQLPFLGSFLFFFFFFHFRFSGGWFVGFHLFFLFFASRWGLVLMGLHKDAIDTRITFASHLLCPAFLNNRRTCNCVQKIKKYLRIQREINPTISEWGMSLNYKEIH